MTSAKELSDDLEERFEKTYNKKVDKLLANVLTATQPSERNAAIAKLREFTKRMHGKDYTWYYEKFVAETSNDEIAKRVENNKAMAFPIEDVYFRKANFVYAFFQEYLEDEYCIVTKDMVNELIDKCEKVLSAARKDGWVDNKGNLKKSLFNDGNISSDKADKLPKSWVDVASDILPTQAGFFFGSTDYDGWYLWKVKSCISQFKKLLRTWKDGEYVYNYMSW